MTNPTNRTPPTSGNDDPFRDYQPGQPLGDWLRELRDRLGRYRFNRATEASLQRDLALALAQLDVACARELILGNGTRLDHFLPASRVACECKIAGSFGDLLGQVDGYLGQPEVAGVLVVTSRHGHRGLPDELRGKPVAVLWAGAQL